jgi:hypothetical protein
MKVAIYLNLMPRLETCRALLPWSLTQSRRSICAWGILHGYFYRSCIMCSRDISVGIAKGHWQDGRDRLWGPPSPLSNGYGGLFLPGREADHSPPSSDEVKNVGTISPLPDMSSWRGA